MFVVVVVIAVSVCLFFLKRKGAVAWRLLLLTWMVVVVFGLILGQCVDVLVSYIVAQDFGFRMFLRCVSFCYGYAGLACFVLADSFCVDTGHNWHVFDGVYDAYR